MLDRLETCRVYRAIITLSSLQISDMYTNTTRFYVSLNIDYNMRIFELCTFPKSVNALRVYIEFCIVGYHCSGIIEMC